MPTIMGNTGNKFYSAGNIEFTNLVPLAPGISNAKPDGYDGARPGGIAPQVRRDLNDVIIPSTSHHLPALPNNLTEVKGPSGRSDQLRRQCQNAGAIGARSMFELQNYGNSVPMYDGNAYATVGSYHAGEGSLRMYATHPRQSSSGQTEYHMTQLEAYAMTGSIQNFRQGATALRNSRDLSKEQRDRFIANANATAQTLAATPTSASTTASRTTASSGTRRDPVQSDTLSDESDPSTDELALGYESSSKRQRSKSIATPTHAGSAREPGRQRQATRTTSTAHAIDTWNGYRRKRLQNGTYEIECTISGRKQTRYARWTTGQACPQIFVARSQQWLQSSLEGQSLRLFVHGRWVVLGRSAS